MNEKLFSKRWRKQISLRFIIVLLVTWILDILIFKAGEIYVVPCGVAFFSLTAIFGDISDNMKVENREISIFWILNESCEKLNEWEANKVNTCLKNSGSSIEILVLIIFIFILTSIDIRVGILIFLIMILANREIFKGIDRMCKNYTKINGIYNGIARQQGRYGDDTYYVSIIDYENKKEVILICTWSNLATLKSREKCTFVYGKISKELLYLY